MHGLLARLVSVLAYLFVAALVYLAGIYVSRLFYFIYLLLIAIPLFSALQLLLTLITLRYSQDFDTEHPIKGESIGYRLNLANESFLASSPVRVRFMSIHPDLDASIEDLSLFFRGRENMRRSYTVSCPYRGIYTVGMESLETNDLLGWFSVNRPVYHRTFYVYPRIVELPPLVAGSRSYGMSDLSSGGRENDFALFEGLTEYREGTPIRHMAWKKFVSTGSPFIRLFGKSAEPGVTIYLDLRRTSPPDPTELEAEDCSIEITVSLLKSLLDHRIPTTVKAMGREPYIFKATDPEAFWGFYRHTINMIFQPTASPASMFQDDRKRAAVSGAVLIVTHMADPEILELPEASDEEPVGLIINQTAMSPETRRSLRSWYESFEGATDQVFLVEGPDTIREDLA